MGIIGIDPGLTGAVAFLTASGEVLELIDTPVATVGRKKVYLVREMSRVILQMSVHSKSGSKVVAIMEDVHPWPGQGVVSSGSLMRGVGTWEGILAALGIPYEFVTPQRWKGTMMDGRGKDKDASRILAQQLFPEIAEKLKLKKDHGKAEALLIAEYRRRLTAVTPSL